MKVLFVGETFFVYETHIKGADTFSETRYVNEVKYIQDALASGGIELEQMPAHMVVDNFPFELSQLSTYDVIMLSDIGAKSFLLSSDTIARSKIVPNRLHIIEQYVKQGGGFCMIGGYMTFAGKEGKANYHGTPVERLLPVEISNQDDRYEVPEGAKITIDQPDHQIFEGIPSDWPRFLGYNRLKAKPNTVLASHEGNAFIAAWDYGKGRSLAFASDCAPHWAPPEFVHWQHYNAFWCNVVHFLTKKKEKQTVKDETMSFLAGT